MAVEMGGRMNTRSQDKNNNQRPPKRKSPSDPDLRSSYLQEIEHLKKEVRHLESEIDQQESTASGTEETTETVFLDLRDTNRTSTVTRTNDSEEFEVEEKALISRIASLEAFTGIRFEKNHCSVSSKSSRKTTWQRSLTGTCQKIPFVVDFEVDEFVQGEEGISDDGTQSTAVITRLSVEVQDSLAAQELCSYIKTVEKDKALQAFFQTLVQYGDCHHNRQKTFFHFKTKFPDVIHLLGGSWQSTAMQMVNPVKPGLVFSVQWKLNTTVTGHVAPDIQVHVTAPLHRGKGPRNPLLRSAPQQFRRMLSILGIEHSIEMLLSIVLRL